MRPGKQEWTGAQDLFRARLDQIINLEHELVRLAGTIGWDWIDTELSGCFSEEGRPGLTTRFMVGLLLLKHIYGLSDDGVCERWVYDPYFQYFTGAEFFAHEFPHERSGMSHWRKRIGGKLDMLLAESLRVAHATGALKTDDLARITVDTTVQPKNVTHPTDAKLMLTAIEKLGALAKTQGCIGKGKAHKPYEFGAKVSVAATNRRCKGGQFVVHAKALPGNPYDGHTLAEVIAETQKLTGREIERAYVDKGYRGHDAPKPLRVFISGQKRGVHGAIKRELRRRSAIEPVIGHMKSDGHLGRNFLKGRHGDQANAVLCAVGHNLRLVLRWLRRLLCLILIAIVDALTAPSDLKSAS